MKTTQAAATRKFVRSAMVGLLGMFAFFLAMVAVPAISQSTGIAQHLCFDRGRRRGLCRRAGGDALGEIRHQQENRGVKGMAEPDRLLVLVRHGQSDWNLKNLFTGWRDVDLTEKGIAEAREAGRKLKGQGIKFDVAFTSALVRAQRTLDLMLEEMGQGQIPVFKDQALNERDYGDLVGLNKDDARKKWGEEQVHIWRRSYDVAPPGGESLRDTTARVLPYYIQEILPRVMRGEHVLVSAHGNSLRALVMVLDKHTTESITKLNLDTGVPMIYRLNAEFDGEVEARSGGLARAKKDPALWAGSLSYQTLLDDLDHLARLRFDDHALVVDDRIAVLGVLRDGAELDARRQRLADHHTFAHGH